VPRTETIYEDEELGLSPGWDEQLDPNIRRELKDSRIARLQLKEAQAELAVFRRNSALATVGIPQDKRGQAFAKVYDGSDDPAEVTQAWEALFGPLDAGSGDEGSTASLTAEERIAAAGSAGANQGTPGTQDIGDAIKAAKTNAEVMEIIRTHGRAAGLSLPADS